MAISKKSKKKKKRFKRHIIRFLAISTLLGFSFVVGLILAVGIGFFGEIPTLEKLQNIKSNSATEIYSADEKLLGRYYYQDRTNISYDEIPESVINALIATEDARFYTHNGIDLRSLIRVMVKSIILGKRSSGGGSTITQQLAKNLFPRKSYSFLSLPVNKIREIIVAKRMEEVYTKEEILTLYLNTVPFGENAFGIEVASERYFSKDTKDLNPEEGAVLIGMLKANTSYNPRLYPEKATKRRNLVLNQMVKYGYINQAYSDSLKVLPIKVDYQKKSSHEGSAPYFRAQLKKELNAILKDKLKADGTPYDLDSDGLKVYTTIDSKLQDYAERAVGKQMGDINRTFKKHWGRSAPWISNPQILEEAVRKSKRYKKLAAEGKSEEEITQIFQQKVPMQIFTFEGERDIELSPLDSVKHYLYFLNTGFIAIEPKTGAVKAWVGGINHKFFPFDHVNKNTKRQVGSTFKPFVYTAALEQGIEPCEYFENEPITYEEYEDWTPKNADDVYGGQYSMRGALMNSINTVSVQLLMQAKSENVIMVAKRMGIESPIQNVPSIALGTPTLSLYEMVSAYATFANKGKRIPAFTIIKVEDSKGNILYEHKEAYSKAVISEENAETMLEMLKGVIDEGTGRRLRYYYHLRNDIAGKTGTSQSQADGWFIGITPNLVAGAWVGADDPRIHFRSLNLGQGANTALPIFGYFMRQVNADKNMTSISRARFPIASAEIWEKLQCEPYLDEMSVDEDSLLNNERNNWFKQLFGNPNRDKQEESRKERKKRKSKRKKNKK
ncbi:transglycosylase domain-containing protein, partial [Xanthovirga aplysinae]|uniref:transglycosylase domain-containing protein n=1 Tax=Xanthovirga aplysinae TaxID=2529853 RepID=UPI0012BC5786